jgi:hypothetical protein
MNAAYGGSGSPAALTKLVDHVFPDVSVRLPE